MKKSQLLGFMKWLGIELDLSCTTYLRNFPISTGMHVNIKCVESILNYSFKDPTLVVEALTHGSFMLPEIPRCYQRLEFLGDVVLDYLITIHLYAKYPEMTPGLLTDLRSASVNNECYALSAVRAGLHKHILHASQTLYRQMAVAVKSFQQSSLETTFGWECEVNFPKVLADVIESLAGAIFVDSGFNKEVVFKCMLPLLAPLVTPDTVKLNPVRELHFICQKHHYTLKKNKTCEDGVSSIVLSVEANGSIYEYKCTSSSKDMATKIASKEVLKLLRESIKDS